LTLLHAEVADAAPWIERLARVGYVAKAVLYGTIGVLAAAAAAGTGGKETDTRGAMATVLDAPFGKVLLIAIALGLLGYAAWRFAAAVVDPEHRGSDAKGLAIRASYFGRGAIHVGLAYSAIRLAMGHSGQASSSGARAKDMTATAMDTHGGGEWLVWAIALGVGAYGAYQLYRAATATLGKELDLGRAQGETGGWIIAMCRLGIAARGVVFIAIGWMLSRAAADHNANRAGGISDALRTLERLGHGPFTAIAIGLIAYGGYQLVNARYRRIRAA
jgi:hypothetical protein